MKKTEYIAHMAELGFNRAQALEIARVSYTANFEATPTRKAQKNRKFYYSAFYHSQEVIKQEYVKYGAKYTIDGNIMKDRR